MKNKNQLAMILANHQVQSYLGFNLSSKELLKMLKDRLYPKEFIDSIMELFSIQLNSPEQFKEIVACYQNDVFKQLTAQLNVLLAFIQRTLHYTEFTYADEFISSNNLARRLFTEFTGDQTEHEFSIGPYRVCITMGVKRGEDDKSPFCLFQVYRGEELVLNEGCSIITRWSNVLDTRLEKMSCSFESILERVGQRGLHLNMSKTLSFVGLIIKDESEKEGKKVPVWFDQQRREINRLVFNGDLNTLKKLLRKEYKKQKPLILPDAMTILHNFGIELINDCKRNAILNDPKIGILDKIHNNIANGWYKIMTVPVIENVTVNSSKETFLLAYRDEEQVQMIADVLGHAGWGGSLLIGSYNFPSIHEVLQSGQVDYLVQSSLGHHHDKDLYEEEIDGWPYAKDWEGKVLRCEIFSQGSEEYYAQDFTKEKIVRFRYQRPQMQTSVA